MILTGRVNGETVEFRRREGRWEATLPRTLTGRFVVELRAVDEAGNESRYATVLMTVDRGTVQVALLPDRAAAQLLPAACRGEAMEG